MFSLKGAIDLPSGHPARCCNCTKPGTHKWAHKPNDLFCKKCVNSAYEDAHYEIMAEADADYLSESGVSDIMLVAESLPTPKRVKTTCAYCGSDRRYYGAKVWTCEDCRAVEEGK